MGSEDDPSGIAQMFLLSFTISGYLFQLQKDWKYW